MNRLWKRLVMLGALIGCMATAAWAGNVNVDIYGVDIYHYVFGYGNYVSIIGATDGYYHIRTTYPEAWAPLSQVYHFDKNGNVAWMEQIDGDHLMAVIRYTYDENGNLLCMRYSSGISWEYTYDEQNRMLTEELTDGESSWKTLYSYEEGKIVCDSLQNGKLCQQTEYTINAKGQVIKAITYDVGSDQLTKELYNMAEFTYDENDNLVSSKFYSCDDDKWEIAHYVYDENGKCLERTVEGSNISDHYEYDDYGNMIDDGAHHTYEKLTPIQDDSAYNDVIDKNEYYYDAVNWATLAGVTQGTSDTTFSPNQSCTRAQLVTFLWRAAGSPEPETSENPFTDVAAGSYYEKAVLWAVENNITNGVDVGRFAPDGTCTRAQIVTFIYRAAGEPDIEVQSEFFTDVAADAYYAKAVAWAVANDITNGVDVGLFAPDRTCTRGQGVTFLYRGIGLY